MDAMDVRRRVPRALEHLEEIAQQRRNRRLAVFLDYDGTLTPIVDRPELAVLSAEMRDTLSRLARVCTVAVVSGRDRADVERLVGLDSIYYAGSHGFDIGGPSGREIQYQPGQQFTGPLRRAESELRARLGPIPGVLVEGKRYAVAVHFRLVAPREVPGVQEAFEEVAGAHPELRQTGGKMVLELRPKLDWDKGKAMLWLLETLELRGDTTLALYIGDDETDEDAFGAIEPVGIGILVAEEDDRPTAARYRLGTPGDVRVFLGHLIEGVAGGAKGRR